MFKALTVYAFLGLQMLSSLAGPVESSPDANELVMTPGGLIPKSNIHAVPAGTRVHHTQGQVQLISPNGTVLHTVPVTSDKLSISPNAGKTTRRALQSGYVAWSAWQNPTTDCITSFSTTWTVPPIPATPTGQLLYWFNGLEPSSFDAILQPVLQYGVSPAGGGNFYSITPWYVAGNGAFHGPLTTVQPGQQLTGVMSLTNSVVSDTATTYTYSTSFPGISSTLVLITQQELTLALEALEIYGPVQVPTQLPAGHTAFTGINIQGPPVSSIGWTPVSDNNDHLTMSIISTSPTNGAVQVNYPQ